MANQKCESGVLKCLPLPKEQQESMQKELNETLLFCCAFLLLQIKMASLSNVCHSARTMLLILTVCVN